MSAAHMRRLTKLEARNGVKRTCLMCDAIDRCHARLKAIRRIHAPPIWSRQVCDYCNRMRSFDNSDHTPEISAISARVQELRDARQLCAPELVELSRRFDELCRARGLEVYGPTYPEVMAALEVELDTALAAIGPSQYTLQCAVVPCRCAEVSPEMSERCQRILDAAEAQDAPWLAELDATLEREQKQKRKGF